MVTQLSAAGIQQIVSATGELTKKLVRDAMQLHRRRYQRQSLPQQSRPLIDGKPAPRWEGKKILIRYEREDYSAIARSRCEAKHAAGKPADYSREFRRLVSGRSQLTVLEQAKVHDRHSAETRRNIDAIKERAMVQQRYSRKRPSETNPEFDRRISREARDRCLEMHAAGQDCEYGEVLEALRDGVKPGQPLRYQRRSGETAVEFQQRTAAIARNKCTRAAARGETLDYATVVAQIRGK